MQLPSSIYIYPLIQKSKNSIKKHYLSTCKIYRKSILSVFYWIWAHLGNGHFTIVNLIVRLGISAFDPFENRPRLCLLLKHIWLYVYYQYLPYRSTQEVSSRLNRKWKIRTKNFTSKLPKPSSGLSFYKAQTRSSRHSP